jgi:hypothetical protein
MPDWSEPEQLTFDFRPRFRVRKVVRCHLNISVRVTDADRSVEQWVKESLDALGWAVRFHRDYDEPNEIFAPRFAAAYPQLEHYIYALPFWRPAWLNGPCNSTISAIPIPCGGDAPEREPPFQGRRCNPYISAAVQAAAPTRAAETGSCKTRRTDMPKIKVPSALQEIAAELGHDLGHEHEETENLRKLIDKVRDQLDEQHAEALDEADQYFHGLEEKLDAINIQEPTE